MIHFCLVNLNNFKISLMKHLVMNYEYGKRLSDGQTESKI